jgi:parvulin-like peptidyl-prolyl isomerase
MRKTHFPFLLLTALTLLAAGCADDGGESVAEVGDAVVTVDDVSATIGSLGQQGQRMAASAEGRRQLIERAISDELIYQAALGEGIDELPEVEERIEQAVRNIVIGYYLQTAFADMGFTEEEIEGYYNTHQEEFQRPAQAHIRHLQLESAADADRAFERLEAGESFGEVAESFGIDPRTTQQLVLSSEASGAPPRLVEAVFAAEAGALIGPLELEDGYHLVKVLELRSGEPLLLEEARQQVVESLLVSEEDARHYYEENRELFDRPEAAKLRFMIVAERERAEELSAELTAGADFAELAAAESIDPVYGPRGGLVERFYKGSQLSGFQQSPDLDTFTETVFSLEPGELGGPVELDRGWLIVRVEERFPAEQSSYDEVRSRVREMLLQERLLGREESFLAELEGEVGIDKNQELIDRWIETGEFYETATTPPGADQASPADAEVN